MTGKEFQNLREVSSLSVEDASRLLKRSIKTIEFWESIKTDSVPHLIGNVISNYNPN
jgi:DNA-binding transcriptional regulator YiaG